MLKPDDFIFPDELLEGGRQRSSINSPLAWRRLLTSQQPIDDTEVETSDLELSCDILELVCDLEPTNTDLPKENCDLRLKLTELQTNSTTDSTD